MATISEIDRFSRKPRRETVLKDREYTLILPKGYNGKRIPEKQIDDIAKRISSRFGGVTIQDGFGGWVSGKGEYIDEPVYLFKVNRDLQKNQPMSIHEEDRDFLDNLSNELGLKYNQDLMLETTDRVDVRLITPKKKEQLEKVV